MRCDKCDSECLLFHKTKAGKIYCPDCWMGILKWLRETNKSGGCIMCHENVIYWEDDTFTSLGQVRLCEKCYYKIFPELKKEGEYESISKV